MQIEKFGLHHFLSELLDCPFFLFKEKMVSLWLSILLLQWFLQSLGPLLWSVYSLTGNLWRPGYWLLWAKFS